MVVAIWLVDGVCIGTTGKVVWGFRGLRPYVGNTNMDIPGGGPNEI